MYILNILNKFNQIKSNLQLFFQFFQILDLVNKIINKSFPKIEFRTFKLLNLALQLI